VLHAFSVGSFGKAWRSNGTFDPDHAKQHPADIVAEWIEPAVEPAAEPATLTLKAGGTYRTRGGEIVGPIRASHSDEWGDEWVFTNGDEAWRADGSYDCFNATTEDDMDIVSLIEPATPTPKFKVGDRVVAVKGTNLLKVGQEYEILRYEDGEPVVEVYGHTGVRFELAYPDRWFCSPIPVGSTVTFTATGRL
jgi:hypothetical protein